MTRRYVDAIQLVLLSIASLCFITVVDNVSAKLFGLFSESLVPLAHARFPSFMLSLLILFIIDRDALRRPLHDLNWFRLIRTALLWLTPAAIGVFYLKIWVPNISGWIDITAFLFTGLCAEEFLFRGCLYSLSERLFGGVTIFRMPVSIVYSSVFFGLQHLQYHSFNFSIPALTQVAYTFVMGVFFGLIRHYGKSIWPAVGVHMTNNAFTVIRNIIGS